MKFVWNYKNQRAKVVEFLSPQLYELYEKLSEIGKYVLQTFYEIETK